MSTQLENPASLLAKLNQSKALKANDAAYQTIKDLLGLVGQNNTTINNDITNNDQGIIDINIIINNLKNATFLTSTDQTALLALSRMLVAGTNVTFDLTTPGELIINSSGSGGGSWIPLVTGSEPPTFVTDGAGHLILVAYP